MKKNYFLLLFSFVVIITNAQVGIGTLTPNPKSTLDIVAPVGTATAMGIILPRATQAQINATVPDATNEGMLIQDTDNKCQRSIRGGTWTGCLDADPNPTATFLPPRY